MPHRYALHHSDGTIVIDGLIRSDDVSAAAMRRSLDELRDEPELRVLMQSDGGAVDEGWAIYNLLRNVGKPIEVTIRWAASMAALVAMAGSRIRIQENGAFALHHVGMTPDLFELVHNSCRHLTGRALIALARDLGRIDEVHADIICSRTGLDRRTVMRLREDETVVDAAEAVRLGLAEEIITTGAQH